MRATNAAQEGKSKPPAQPQRKLKLNKHTLLPFPPLLGLFGNDEKRSGEEKQEEEMAKKNDEEKGDEDEIEESDGAAEVRMRITRRRLQMTRASRNARPTFRSD
jgi:hypothetical protein